MVIAVHRLGLTHILAASYNADAKATVTPVAIPFLWVMVEMDSLQETLPLFCER